MWQHLVCPNQHVPKHLYLIGYFSQQLFGTSRSLPLNRPPSLVKQAKKKSIKICCKYVNTPMITKCPSAIPNKWVWCRWLNMCLCMCTKSKSTQICMLWVYCIYCCVASASTCGLHCWRCISHCCYRKDEERKGEQASVQQSVPYTKKRWSGIWISQKWNLLTS